MRIVVRPAPVQYVGYGFMVVVFAGTAFVGGAVGFDPSSGTGMRIAFGIGGVIASIATIVVGWRLTRLGAVVDDDGIRVSSPFRTWRWSWTSVERIHVGPAPSSQVPASNVWIADGNRSRPIDVFARVRGTGGDAAVAAVATRLASHPSFVGTLDVPDAATDEELRPLRRRTLLVLVPVLVISVVRLALLFGSDPPENEFADQQERAEGECYDTTDLGLFGTTVPSSTIVSTTPEIGFAHDTDCGRPHHGEVLEVLQVPARTSRSDATDRCDEAIDLEPHQILVLDFETRHGEDDRRLVCAVENEDGHLLPGR